MLLTSGQVSVAVSSGIIFLCTAALFLSGYALQQRTLRDLREAIKPGTQPSTPKIFLPDRFKESPAELPDEPVDEELIQVRPTMPDTAYRKAKSSRSKKGTGSYAAQHSETQQKEMSRAERRRRIREEIMRLGQGEDQKAYYQRRPR